jgi:hypothetical protein
MIRSMLRLAAVCLATAFCGWFFGAFAGIVIESGPCAVFESAYAWSGAILGGGVGAVIVFSERPDPRAFNRQDPPDPPSR